MSGNSLPLALLFGWSLSASAGSDFDACALEQLKQGDGGQTAADILAYCSQEDGTKEEAVAATAPIETETRVQAAFRAEADAAASDFVVSLYQPNYIWPPDLLPTLSDRSSAE